MLKHNYLFEAIGTQWGIETNDVMTPQLKTAIQNRIEEFDVTYSRFRSDSLVTRVSQKAGDYLFPNDAKQIVGFYEQLYEITSGKVTPLIGNVLERAGYDANYSLKPQIQKPIMRWQDVMIWDKTTVRTSQPILLDIGAAGKGYLIDTIAKILDENSVIEYVIDASGDLLHKGPSENRVGLEHPLDPRKIIGVVKVQNKSLCASASNRRAWGEGMHHIFDPDSLAPTQDVIATWVIADEAMVADGLATALFFTDAEKLKKKFEFEYARMHANGVIEFSPYFKNGLF